MLVKGILKKKKATHNSNHVDPLIIHIVKKATLKYIVRFNFINTIEMSFEALYITILLSIISISTT